MAIVAAGRIEVGPAGSISANGGHGGVGGVSMFPFGKYPPPTTRQGDDEPVGGFGGDGLVQLVSRPGANADGTNTVLDDSIDVVLSSGVVATGATKTRYLAWRGFLDPSGVPVDDDNQPTYAASPQTAFDEGDITPAPVLLPLW